MPMPVDVKSRPVLSFSTVPFFILKEKMVVYNNLLAMVDVPIK